MSKIPFIDLKIGTSLIRSEVDRAIAGVIDDTSFVLGPELEGFEREFASYCEASHCAGMSSGTSALHLILLAYGIGPGDEVITVPNTFVATAEAIVMAGARPVLVDVRDETALIDVEQAREAVSSNTKAIIAVHLFGQCCDMDPLMELAGDKGMVIIEDACQAHGAAYKGRKAGSLGHAAAFSFYPSKNLGAFGEAGAVTTQDGKLIESVKALRHHAQFEKNVHARIGYNYRLDCIQAAVLRVKLKYLDEWNENRRNLAGIYRKNLEDTGYHLFEEKSDCRHVYHLFTVGCTDKEAVQKGLTDAGIAWGQHYPIPVHLQPAFSFLEMGKGRFPVAEKLMDETISLPMFPELKEEEVVEICDILRGIESSV